MLGRGNVANKKALARAGWPHSEGREEKLLLRG